ncbi:hypothetical protein Bca4012_049785 [Brassica carinata]|uniref:Peptidase A1 domain-containing protein n=1 Tax=Brassica carinata TaxID=52824 RepID=A0A8X7UIU4_BRACI|nr:hypothetical protein Bca52824_052530 [Brassica carinata]
MMITQKSKPHTFVIPIFKDNKTYLYYTNRTVGQPPLVVKLVVELGGSALFFQCDRISYNSTTYTHVLCGSPGCAQTKDRCTSCSSAPLGLHAETTRVSLNYTSPSTYLAPKLAVRTRLTCVGVFEDSGWSDLPNGANSILGLADSSMSFVKSVESSYKIPFKVALCLPSKPKNNSGSVYIGRLLVSTPLVSIPENGVDNYYIDVKSIEVNGNKLSFNQDFLTFNKTTHWRGTKISSIIPYTLFYKSFGGKSLLGKKTPVISFVLGGGAKWDIYGTNSLVMVNKTIMCLAFVDARNDPRFPIEMGGYQMEDHLVEFDFEASTFSFTSSLLRHNASCSRM